MKTLVRSLLALCGALSIVSYAVAQVDSGVAAGNGQQLRLGVIGLDTSHAPAFTKLINSTENSGSLARMQVVAAFPGGSPDIPSSANRVQGFTEQLRGMGVEIVDSIEDLLPKVDAVLLESVDGRKHLEQALPVFKAGKPMFIDKPLAANLADVLAIDLLAQKYNARWFSSSSLRFSPGFLRFREDPKLAEKVRGAFAWSPCSLEESHADLFWYGVHGVETLYTAMGTGCKRVTRVSTPGTDVVTGEWDDGRVGTFRGIRAGKGGYGMVVFTDELIDTDGKYTGYQPLVERIGDFLLGGEHPVPNAETIEMFTFMQAADVSKENDGKPVDLSEVKMKALAKAKRIVERLEKS